MKTPKTVAYPYVTGLFARPRKPKRIAASIATRMGTTFANSPQLRALLSTKGGPHV